MLKTVPYQIKDNEIWLSLRRRRRVNTGREVKIVQEVGLDANLQVIRGCKRKEGYLVPLEDGDNGVRTRYVKLTEITYIGVYKEGKTTQVLELYVIIGENRKEGKMILQRIRDVKKDVLETLKQDISKAIEEEK